MEIFVGIKNRMPFVTVEGKPRSTASLDMDFLESASSVEAVFSSQAHLTPFPPSDDRTKERHLVADKSRMLHTHASYRI